MKRLLVVDDDHDLLDSLKLLLESYYDLCLAEQGTDALIEIERGFKPDAILLDLTMPVMDGPEMLREMRRRGLKIPVLLISSHPGAEELAREIGADDSLRKPFTYEQLRAKLDSVLKSDPSDRPPLPQRRPKL